MARDRDGPWPPSPAGRLVFALLAGAPLGFALVPPAALLRGAEESHVALSRRVAPAWEFPRAMMPGGAYPCAVRPPGPRPAG